MSAPPPMHNQIQRDTSGRILRDAVEFAVVSHCNLRCAGCDHASPHLPPSFAAVASFAADMNSLSRHMHVRVLRLLGGEPLLHPQLEEFVRAARDSGIADKVALWTNGLLLHAVPRTLLEAFDLIHVSLYPGISVRADLVKLEHELINASGTQLEFFRISRFLHQLLNAPSGDSLRVRRTFNRCKETHVWSCHTVCDGHYYKCTKPPLLAIRLESHRPSLDHDFHDGVALHSNRCLADDLEAYLLADEPLFACNYCLGTDGKSFSHHQLDRPGLERERQLDTLAGHSRAASRFTRLARDLRDIVQQQ